MRRKTGIGLVLLLMAAAPAYSQQSTTPPNATTPDSKQSAPTTPAPTIKTPPSASIRNWKSYCSEEAEYCVSYPPDWDLVGDVMEGNGAVMAPPQGKKDKSLWNQVTVSVTDLPEPEKGKEPASFDDILTSALSGLPGKNVQTLQRSELTLHGRDAELVKVKYEDKETGQPWVEEIVFIDDELAIYSIALRATPDDVDSLEETFRRIVATWRPSEAPPAVPPKRATPQKPTTSKPPSTKALATKPTPPK